MKQWRWIGLGLVAVLALGVIEILRTDPHGNQLPPESAWAAAFVEAAGMGDIRTVLSLLEKGVDVNVRDKTFGHTALIVAARKGHIDVVQALLDGGADVNAEDNYGHTAMRWAKKNGAREIVELLRKAGAYEPLILA